MSSAAASAIIVATSARITSTSTTTTTDCDEAREAIKFICFNCTLFVLPLARQEREVRTQWPTTQQQSDKPEQPQPPTLELRFVVLDLESVSLQRARGRERNK